MKIDKEQCFDSYRGKGWIALRRTIPLWSWEKNLTELLDACPKYGIDEVVVKVDTEEFSHGIPSVEWLKEYQIVLFEIKKELEGIGVVFSVNPWATHVHADRGRNLKKTFPKMNFIVGHDGSQCQDCACSLSSVWREHTVALWKIYAETKPNIIWVEDDIRTFNHFPVQFGCFCPEHLKQFAERIGKNITREELVGLILSSGSPHPYRKEWLDVQSEIMIDVARIISSAVHEVSPKTKVGLMSSGPDYHCLEGRRWHDFIYALAGDNIPVSRPPLGNYMETNLKGLYYTANSLRRTRYVLPKNTIEMAEVENYPYSQYSKSNTFTFLQTAVCFSMGAQGVAMNLFDHCGTPMSAEISVLQSLQQNKKYLQALTDKCIPSGKFSGIRILHHDKTSYHKHLSEDSSYDNLQEESFGWEDPLQAFGFATTYEQSNLVALTGQSIRCLTSNEILKLLSTGVLCDLTATETLIEMGFGKYLGVALKRRFKRKDLPIAAEHFFNTDFGGEKDRYFALTTYPDDTSIGELEAQASTIEISEIVDPNTNRLFPGLTLFENSLGGRIAIYPVEMDVSLRWIFTRPIRQIQMTKILEWLSRDTLPLMVKGGHNVLPLRMDFDDKIIVAVFCLSLDDWNGLELLINTKQQKVSKIMRLAESENWELFDSFACGKDRLTIKYSKELDYKKPLVLEISFC